MEIVYILIPLSVILLAIAVAIFIWATNSGQFEDLDSPAWRILRDEQAQRTTKHAPRVADCDGDVRNGN